MKKATWFSGCLSFCCHPACRQALISLRLLLLNRNKFISTPLQIFSFPSFLSFVYFARLLSCTCCSPPPPQYQHASQASTQSENKSSFRDQPLRTTKFTVFYTKAYSQRFSKEIFFSLSQQPSRLFPAW